VELAVRLRRNELVEIIESQPETQKQIDDLQMITESAEMKFRRNYSIVG